MPTTMYYEVLEDIHERQNLQIRADSTGTGSQEAARRARSSIILQPVLAKSPLESTVGFPLHTQGVAF